MEDESLGEPSPTPNGSTEALLSSRSQKIENRIVMRKRGLLHQADFVPGETHQGKFPHQGDQIRAFGGEGRNHLSTSHIETPHAYSLPNNIQHTEHRLISKRASVEVSI